MEQSPSWEANWFCSYSGDSPHFWNPKVPHRTHKRPPPAPILSQLHPVPTTPSHFLKIHPNIILPSTSGSPQWSLSLRFPNQNPVHTSPLPHTRHMSRLSLTEVFNGTRLGYRDGIKASINRSKLSYTGKGTAIIRLFNLQHGFKVCHPRCVCN